MLFCLLLRVENVGCFSVTCSPPSFGPRSSRVEDRKREKREQKSSSTPENWSVGHRQVLMASLRFGAGLTLAGSQVVAPSQWCLWALGSVFNFPLAEDIFIRRYPGFSSFYPIVLIPNPLSGSPGEGRSSLALAMGQRWW
jgi:hypothetical protein